MGSMPEDRNMSNRVNNNPSIANNNQPNEVDDMVQSITRLSLAVHKSPGVFGLPECKEPNPFVGIVNANQMPKYMEKPNETSYQSDDLKGKVSVQVCDVDQLFANMKSIFLNNNDIQVFLCYILFDSIY